LFNQKETEYARAKQSMGFDVTLVDASAKKESNVCPHCHLILDTPLQTEEGIRLCKGCLEEIKIVKSQVEQTDF
jgi:hypothetical protein